LSVAFGGVRPGGADAVDARSKELGMARSTRSRITNTAFAGIALVAVAAGCGSDDDAITVNETAVGEAVESAGSVVADVAEEAEAAQTDLAQVLRDNGAENIAGLVEQVDISQIIGTEEFTFLAPNDTAFTSLSADEMADLLSDPAGLGDVLRNHVVNERMSSDDLADMDDVRAASGQTLAVVAAGDSVKIGEATVVTADIEAGDGVIHIIDRLLVP
jgi:uncharacterized surface protein with fasciclin (FAS1) repeats